MNARTFFIRLLIVLVVFFTTTFISRLLIVPFIYGLDGDFEYTAGIVSLDNFFNEETKMFSGEKRSVSSFGYLFSQKQGREVSLINFFDVRTIEGERIIRVEREYGIDSRTGKHILGLGDKDRGGYLFAPRHLKKVESFSYWHVNYDKELELVFEGEENIRGLDTYRYTVSFGVDQTNDLTHLPLVPEERGINLDATLSLWVEPVSGRLIKYEDRAIAYYYDQETGKRLHPWNKFSNKFLQRSILDQVEIAKKQKRGIILFELIIPVLLSIGTIGLFFWKTRKKVSLAVFLFGLIVAGLIFTYFSIDSFSRLEKIQIGITRWVPTGNKAYDANIQGFKDALTQAGYREGKDIVYLEEYAEGNADRQRVILQTFLSKNVNLIYSLTTLGTLIAKEIVTSRPVVFSVVTYPEDVGIIETLSSSGNNFVGTRNWVSSKEQLKVFLDMVPNIKSIGFVHRTGEPNSLIQLEEMKNAAEAFGIDVIKISGKDLSELSNSLESTKDVEGLFSACDTLVQAEAEEVIISYAHTHKIPSFSCNTSGPFKGDLVGTVADFYQIGKLAGEKAVAILEGASPSSLETNTVTRPFIYVNQRTADLLGITIPLSVFTKAKEVIR